MIMSGKKKIRIKNSVIIVGNINQDTVSQLIKSFDLADKTPNDCFEFVRKLKSLLE